MSQVLRLSRGTVMPFAAVPRAVRAGDYIFTSSIYPVDAHGAAIGTNGNLGEAGPSLIAEQTRRCLRILGEVLEESGGALDGILKADVHLADAADFYEFKLVWREHFPHDPPARTTVVVGDTFPFPGARLSMDVVALAADSPLQREVLNDPGGPDPLDAEWAPWAVRAGNLVFCSGFAATDFSTGLAIPRDPRFPNYGSDGVTQANYFFERLNCVLAQAGTSLEHALESYLYEPDLKTFNDVDGVWGRYMPLPPGRASMGIKGLLVPGACFVASMTVLVPDKDHIKEESREGITYHPAQRRKVNYTPTLKAGPWLYLGGKTSGNMETVVAAPKGLPHHFSDIEIQTRNIMEFLTNQIEANNSDWAHCHHVRVWLTEPKRDYRGFMRVWKEYFPDPQVAPALAYVPATATMYPGPVVEIDPTCVLRS